MTKTYTISVPQLKKAGACRAQLERFAKIFGKTRQVPLNQDVALIIQKVFFRTDWVVDYLMTPKARNAYYEQRRAVKYVIHNPATGKDEPNPNRDLQIAEALVKTYRPRKFT